MGTFLAGEDGAIVLPQEWPALTYFEARDEESGHQERYLLEEGVNEYVFVIPSPKQMQNISVFLFLTGVCNNCSVGHLSKYRSIVTHKCFCNKCEKLLETDMSVICVGSENIPADISNRALYNCAGKCVSGVVWSVHM